MKIKTEQLKNAYEGQEFKNKKEMYDLFIQENVPGGRNADFAFEELERYFELEKIDKRKYRIKKIKLTPDEKMKKSGGANNKIYSDYVKLMFKYYGDFTIIGSHIAFAQ